MGRKSVAVLDVRSSEVTVLIGERGVNHTFVFKASRTEPYEGYDEDGAFFADKGFADAVLRAVDGVERVCGERIRTLYVGVPGMFTLVVPKEHEISFPASKRISQRDVTLLFDSGREECPGYRFIRATSMFFLTSDKRRVIDPVGLVSDKLSGLLTYFYCSNYFAERMQSVFGHLPVELHYLPSEAVQASYLIPPETRDETALFLDTGYIPAGRNRNVIPTAYVVTGFIEFLRTFAWIRSPVEFPLSVQALPELTVLWKHLFRTFHIAEREEISARLFFVERQFLRCLPFGSGRMGFCSIEEAA